MHHEVRSQLQGIELYREANTARSDYRRSGISLPSLRQWLWRNEAHIVEGQRSPRSPRTLRALIATGRSPAAMAAVFGLLVVASAALHLQVIATSTGVSYDIQSYAIQAATTLHHQNVYDVTTRYPYPPVWIWIVALMQVLATATQLPFGAVVELPALLGDLALMSLIYRYAQRRFGPSLYALLLAALFGLNPVTLLVSAGHGQFDSLVLFFLLLAAYLRAPTPDLPPDRKSNFRQSHALWSACALGVAVALKGYPILYAPYLVASAPKGRRIASALLVLAPLVISGVIYSLMFGFSSQMLPNILQYSSTYDAGWGFVLLRVDPTISMATLKLLSGIAKVTLMLCALDVPFVVARRAPAKAALLIFATFSATTVAMSVQYVLWILPFLCLVAPWWVIPYSAAALAALVPFYLRVFPGALPAGPGWSALFAPFSSHRTIGVASIIAISALLTVSLLARAWKTRRDGGSPADAPQVE